MNREVSPYLITSGHTKIGHKDYAAPELTKGQPINDRCDIYSIGLTIFYLMSFKLPYNSYIDKINNNIIRISNGNTLNIFYSIELRNLVMKMINENPDKRPSAREVLEELKKIEKKIFFYNKEKSLVISLFTCIFSIEELNLELINKKIKKIENKKKFFYLLKL